MISGDTLFDDQDAITGVSADLATVLVNAEHGRLGAFLGDYDELPDLLDVGFFSDRVDTLNLHFFCAALCA